MTPLRGITWGHPRGEAPLMALGEHSGSSGEIMVKWSARSLQAFADFPLERLADDYDLLVIDHPHVPRAAAEGLLVALDAVGRDVERTRLAEQSVGASYASYEHAGHLWALPIDAAAQVSAHRPDLLGDAPESWDDVLDLARDGRVLWPTKPLDAMSSFLTLVAQRGGTVCASPDAFVDRDLGLAVLSFMSFLSELVEPACREENPIETAERLAVGEQWFYAPLLFGYVNYARQGFRPHQLAFRDIPLGEHGVAGSCLGGAGIAVSARSESVEDAVDVAYWLSSAEIQGGPYYHYGGQPANAVAWEDPQVNADCMDFFTGTRATLEGAVIRPRERAWLDLQELLGDLVHETLWRRVSSTECLDRVDAAWRVSSGAGAES